MVVVRLVLNWLRLWCKCSTLILIDVVQALAFAVVALAVIALAELALAVPSSILPVALALAFALRLPAIFRQMPNSSTVVAGPFVGFTLSFPFCVEDVIVGGDEGPIGGVAQVIGCHGVKVGVGDQEEGQEEKVEKQGEVEGEGKVTHGWNADGVTNAVRP